MKRKMLAGLAALVVMVMGGLAFQGDVGAASLKTNVEISVNATLAGDVGLATASVPLAVKKQIEFANGVAANQADKVYSASYSILTGATENIDVKGALVDALGAAFTPAKLKLVYIYSRPTNSTNLTLLGNANSVPILGTAATTTVLDPGGLFHVLRPGLAGITVTAGTGDIIQVVNAAGATAVVDVILVGTSS